jgi:hypothetical protein
MKPTLDNIKAALDSAEALHKLTKGAASSLHAARQLWQVDATDATRYHVRQARRDLVKLRRTQTAALRNIDEALASIDETIKGPQ